MTEALERIARRILAQEGTDSAEQVATAVTNACERLTRDLAPLIGEMGIRALLSRSLTLTRVQYPWLVDPGMDHAKGPWVTLRPGIAAQRHDAALAASVCLLVTFMTLLGTFIGNPLAARLVRAAWPEVFPVGSKKETT